MGGIVRSCLQSFMKAMNLIMGMLGVAMILYSFWMVRVWQRDKAESSSHDFDSTAPWFIYTFLGVGVTFCFITCLGHVAADTANCFCLYCYMAIICLVLLLETAMAADIVLNSDWEKDLPEDPTGRFHDFKDFVESNFDIFRWIGLLIILAQGSSILLGMVLKALGPNRGSNYDSDENEYPPTRLPLINHQVQPPAYVIGDPHIALKNDPVKSPTFRWNVKINFELTQIFFLSSSIFSWLTFQVYEPSICFLSLFIGKQVKRAASSMNGIVYECNHDSMIELHQSLQREECF